MMNQHEFDEWSKKLNLTDEAVNEIQRIRNAQPSRRVGGGKVNVSGRFCSKKMGMTIQFESHKVELPAIYMMEFDDNVLEYYDQPPQLKVNYYQSKNGNRKMAYNYTPDFFVIEKDKAYWVEWKTEEKLIELSQKKPDQYHRVDGQWVYVPGKNYANDCDLGFLVRSAVEIKWELIRNLHYLEDYFIKEYELENSVVTRIKEVILSSPGLTLKDLIDNAYGQYSIDDINALIVNNFIYVDLYNSILVEPENVSVYLNKEQSKSFSIIEKTTKEQINTHKIEIKNGSKFVWGEKVWTILNHDKDYLFLNSEENSYHPLPLPIFEEYIAAGYIRGIAKNEESIENEIKNIIFKATEDDLKIANERLEIVNKHLNGEKLDFDSIKVTDRTIRNWVKKYQDAQVLYGNGYIGLIPETKKKGNRNSKIPQSTIDLMEQFIINSYQTIKSKAAKKVYGELLNKCDESNEFKPSYPTFLEKLKQYSVYELTKSREGNRAAYKHEEFYYELEFTTPRHGDRVFEIAHIDHTEVDVELVINGKETKRPWLTLMIDAYSRRILAFYLTFEEPSYRSCMMVIRECVRRFSRLPNTVVVDGGKEFSSIYFESLLAKNNVHKKERPAAKARFGNVVERLFGKANDSLFHNLQGNTKIMKNVRQVTKSVNPKNHAVWTIESLYDRFNSWINEVYDNQENPSLNKTPKKAFEESLVESGSRPNTYISYDETFILMTLPHASGKTRKVYPTSGFKLTYCYYWCEKFRDPRFQNVNVEVRYDPFDVSIAYAFVDGKWEKCLSEEHKILKGKTEKQMKLIAEEIRQQKKNYSRKSVSITPQEIASFILESEKIEETLAHEKYKPMNTAPDLEVISNIPMPSQSKKEYAQKISNDDVTVEEFMPYLEWK